MSKRELYTKDKNTKVHSYKIRFSPEEKQLLDLKRQQYGYKYLSDYIRDASKYILFAINDVNTNVFISCLKSLHFKRVIVTPISFL